MRRIQLKFEPAAGVHLKATSQLESTSAYANLMMKCEAERNFYMYTFALSLFMYAENGLLRPGPLIFRCRIIIRLEAMLMVFRRAKLRLERYQRQAEAREEQASREAAAEEVFLRKDRERFQECDE